jgi:hypothetical protein
MRGRRKLHTTLSALLACVNQKPVHRLMGLLPADDLDLLPLAAVAHTLLLLRMITTAVALPEDTAHAEMATATAIAVRDESTTTIVARPEAIDPLPDDLSKTILHHHEGRHTMTLTAGTILPIPMAQLGLMIDLPEIFLRREMEGTLARATRLVNMSVEADTGNCFHSF